MNLTARTSSRALRLFGAGLLLIGAWSGTAHAVATDGAGQAIIKLKNAVELSEKPTIRRLEKDGEQIASLLQRNGVQATWVRAGAIGTQLIRFHSTVKFWDQQAMLNRLASDPEIEFAMIDRQVEGAVTAPNDPYYTSLADAWALKSTANTAGAKFDGAWDKTRGSANVVVAVLDTGVVYDTPDLHGRLLSGYDFIGDVATANDGDGRDADASDPGNWVSSSDTQNSSFSGCTVRDSTWHGTFVAGQIAANTNNNSGVSGADWNVKVLPIRVLGKCGGLLSDVIDGMLWSAGLAVPGVPTNPNPATVINLSLGSSSACGSAEQSAVDRVRAAGALVVAAAGNGAGTVDSPANCNGVMAIGALDRDGSRAFYSAIGSNVDMMAPGGYNNGLIGLSNSGATSPSSPNLVFKTGTSFASPLVAAAAAILKSIDSSLNPTQLESILESSAASFLTPRLTTCTANIGFSSCNCTTALCGAGMLDVNAAVASARGTAPVANASSTANGLSSSSAQESAAGLNPIVLRGSSSVASSGRTIASYDWTQVSGEQVLSGTNSNADVTLPAPTASSDLVFRLLVTDSVGQTHTSFTAIRVASSGSDASGPAQVANSSQSGGVTQPTSGTDTGGGSTTTPAPAASGGGGGGGGSFGLLGLALLLAAVLSYKYQQGKLKPIKVRRDFHVGK